MVGLLVELDLAADGKAFARHMEGRDIEAEEAGKLRFRPEGEFAHARMHAVSADGEGEDVLAAVLEACVNDIAPVIERGKRRAVADVDAHRTRAFGENEDVIDELNELVSAIDFGDRVFTSTTSSPRIPWARRTRPIGQLA